MQLLYFQELIEALDRLDKKVQEADQGQAQRSSTALHSGSMLRWLEGSSVQGLYKRRVGDWRLIYKIERTELVFITLGPDSIVRKSIGSSWLPG